MLKLEEFNSVHFIGVGGVSMSALAVLTAGLGKRVSGSDADPLALERPAARGLRVYVGADTAAVASAELVVYTASVRADDAERSFARANKIPCVERKRYLAMLARCCRRSVAVAGSHGKTTVSGMICHVWQRLGVAFMGHVGGYSASNGDNAADCGRDWFLTEACEYNRSFLCLTPTVGVILNTAYDHPDTYPTEEALLEAYRTFAARSSIAVCGETCADSVRAAGAVVFGRGAMCDYRAENIRGEQGRYRFSVVCADGARADVSLGIYGAHNVDNALACIAVCREMGLDLCEVCAALEQFAGVRRRFECVGMTERGARVITDYAHHPDEIASALRTAAEIAPRKLFVVFQPHTYSRTAKLMDGFVRVLASCDNLCLLPTFAARERPCDGADAQSLLRRLESAEKPVSYAEDSSALEKFCAQADAGDVLLFLGAGDIDAAARKIARAKR